MRPPTTRSGTERFDTALLDLPRDHCGASHPFNRFVGRDEHVRRPCRACGGRRHSPHAFYSFGRLIPAVAAGLLPLLDTPLGSLGAVGTGVAVRSGERAVLVQPHDRQKGTHG